MIKTSQKDTRPNVIRITPDFIQWYAGIANTDMERLTSERERAINNEQRRRSTMSDYAMEIRQYREAVRSLDERIKAIDITQYEKDAISLQEKIAKLAFVDTVRVRGEKILIRTKLLFTEIRDGDGLRTTKRTCIGAYEIVLNPRTNTQFLRVKNLVFHNSSRGHWSIAEERPCLGEWSGDFGDAFQRQDVYRILDLLYHYLRSTEDSGAYMRSHQWKDRRVGMLTRTALRAGTHCMLTESYSDDFTIESGSLARVLSNDSDYVTVEFKEPIGDPATIGGHDADGLGLDGHCWIVPRGYFMSITKEQYERGITLEELKTTRLEKLDKLPEGSTLSDAKKILKK